MNDNWKNVRNSFYVISWFDKYKYIINMPSMTKPLLESESASIIEDSLITEGAAGRVIATWKICLCRLNIEYHSFPSEVRRSLKCGFLANKVQIASYNLQVTIHCKSFELIFTFKFRVTNCSIYDCKTAIHFYDPFSTKLSILSQEFLSNAYHEWVLLHWIITSFLHI